MFQIKVVDKIKTYFMFNDFFSKDHAVCEIKCQNMMKPDRPQATM
jgi:hypothetical protein